MLHLFGYNYFESRGAQADYHDSYPTREETEKQILWMCNNHLNYDVFLIASEGDDGKLVFEEIDPSLFLE